MASSILIDRREQPKSIERYRKALEPVHVEVKHLALGDAVWQGNGDKHIAEIKRVKDFIASFRNENKDRQTGTRLEDQMARLIDADCVGYLFIVGGYGSDNWGKTVILNPMGIATGDSGLPYSAVVNYLTSIQSLGITVVHVPVEADEGYALAATYRYTQKTKHHVPQRRRVKPLQNASPAVRMVRAVCPRMNQETAEALLAQFGVNGIRSASLAELTKVPRMGVKSAKALKEVLQ